MDNDVKIKHTLMPYNQLQLFMGRHEASGKLSLCLGLSSLGGHNVCEGDIFQGESSPERESEIRLIFSILRDLGAQTLQHFGYGMHSTLPAEKRIN